MNMFKGIQKFRSRVKGLFGQFYRVPYCVPAWGWAEHWAILKCFVTGRVIEGPHKEKLYALVREMTGVKYVFGFNSGQEAIQAALMAGGIGKGDHVIMPSYCCETVAKAILDTGATPLFCDIADDLNPDVDHVLRLLNPSVKAIIFPHLFGNPGRIDLLEKGLEEKGVRSQILLIDDAAQSFGAKLHGKHLGTFGDAGIISFGPGKTMTASGGGLLISSSTKIAKQIVAVETSSPSLEKKLWRLIYWIVFRRWRRYTLPFYRLLWRFLDSGDSGEQDVKRLSNVDAAIAIAQVQRHEALLDIRLWRKEILDDVMEKRFITTLRILKRNRADSANLNVATKYIVAVDRKDDGSVMFEYNRVMEKLRVEIKPLYGPLHKDYRFDGGGTILPKTEARYEKILEIPIEPSIDEKTFQRLMSGILYWLESSVPQRGLDEYDVCHL